MKVEDINFDNISLDEKSYKNILAYNILHKKIIDLKPLRIKFDKVDGIIKIYDGIRYLELSNSCNKFYGKINAVFDRIDYLISKKSGITDSANHNFAKIRTNLYNYLPIVKKLTFHIVIILIKSLVSKNKNNY